MLQMKLKRKIKKEKMDAGGALVNLNVRVL